MANADRPNGLIPIGTKSGSAWTAQVREYPVDSNTAGNIAIGSPVVLEAGGNLELATAGATNVILGVVVGFVPTGNADGDNFLTSANLGVAEHPGYLPAATAGRALVAVGRDILYQAQMDTGTVVAATAVGARANLVGNSVSTTTGRSTAEIDSSGVGQDATFQLQLHDYVRSPDNDLSVEHSKWIVSINLDQNANATAGI